MEEPEKEEQEPKRSAVIIPAFNEADRIAATVRAAAAIEGIERVVVVDDGSSDGTQRAAKAAGADVLRLQRNYGKGFAMNRGIEVVGFEYEVLLFLDADLGHSASEGDRILAPVAADAADLAIGAFSAGGGMGSVKRFAQLGVKALTGERIEAPLSGQRAMNRKAVAALTPFREGYGVETAMTVDAVRAGLRVMEIPVRMDNRPHGRSVEGFRHRGRQGWHVASALGSRVFDKAPKRKPEETP